MPNEKSGKTHIMRSNHTPCKSGHATNKHNAAPAFAFHGGHAELSEEVGRAAVDAPSAFELLDGDLVNGLGKSVRACGTGIIDQDGWGTDGVGGVSVQLADLYRDGLVYESD